jgi:hypothetical protein
LPRTSSRTSSDRPLEFFFDRSLGKLSAHRLRDAGYTVHLIADGNATLDIIAQRFLKAMPAIHRAVHRTDVGFWHVQTGGRITKMWP